MSTVTPIESPPADAGTGLVDVSVVVAVCGEVRDLDVLASGLGAVFQGLAKRHELIFVDDGSAHFEALLAIRREHPEVKVIRFHQGVGESEALSHGLKQARGAYVVTLPPYLQVAPDEVAKVIHLLDEGYDFVSGWRHPRIDPLPNRIQSSTFNFLTRLITRSRFHDLNCNVRGMKRKVIEDITIYADQFRFLPILAERHGFKVSEVKLVHREEMGKSGFFGIGAYSRRFLDILTVFFLTKFTKRPLRFFGPLGSLFLFVGLAINLYLSLDWWLNDESLVNRPLLILGVLLMVLGVQIVSIGLLAEIIIFTHARDFRDYHVDKTLE